MGQTLTNVLVHVVFSTKNRDKLLAADVRPRLHAYIAAIVAGEGGRAFAVGGGLDHIHLLARLPAKMAVSDLMRQVKANSSRWLRETFPALRSFGWQSGYAAFSVSHSQLDAAFRYVETQEEHHRKHSFEDEFVSLLKRNELDYDERYLWT